VPAEVEVIAFQNQTVVYDILFRAASEALRTIAADPKHLGAEIGFPACPLTAQIRAFRAFRPQGRCPLQPGTLVTL
jgi:hypothetical protein